MGIDPSGNFHEGKGTTGWCLLNKETNKIELIGSIAAKMCPTQHEYWKKHIELIDKLKAEYDIVVSMEDYLLYADESRSQVNSRFETPQVIGIIKYHTSEQEIELLMRNAAAVKKRWSDKILVHEGYIETRNGHFYLPNSCSILCLHERDAIRHAVHASRYEI